MPGFILPTPPVPTTMTCPHGGQVVVAPKPPRVLANGGPVITALEQMTVVGCPVLPGPCAKVQWLNVSARVVVGGQPILLQAPPPTPPPAPGNGTTIGASPGPPLVMVLQPRVTAT